jgi:hypothetical protein
MKEADGVTKDFIDVPDFMARHKYVETGLKLHGLLQSNVKLDGNLIVETYEMRRKRLGLDDMPAEEVVRRLKEQKRLLEEEISASVSSSARSSSVENDGYKHNNYDYNSDYNECI